MKTVRKKASAKGKKKKHRHRICFVCWLVVPLVALAALVLDGLGIYPFTAERLLAIGACLFVLLIPFFNEITVKNVSIEKDNASK
jgi:hypothetical protein